MTQRSPKKHGQPRRLEASLWHALVRERGNLRGLTMRIQSTLIAAAALSVGTPSLAKDIKEDPFAYEEREAERERDKEEAAEEAAAKQSFGNPYDFVISAERLLGWAQSKQVWSQKGD